MNDPKNQIKIVFYIMAGLAGLFIFAAILGAGAGYVNKTVIETGVYPQLLMDVLGVGMGVMTVFAMLGLVLQVGITLSKSDEKSKRKGKPKQGEYHD